MISLLSRLYGRDWTSLQPPPVAPEPDRRPIYGPGGIFDAADKRREALQESKLAAKAQAVERRRMLARGEQARKSKAQRLRP